MPKKLPVLSLDVCKTPANMPRAERQITDMELYREVYILPEDIDPMKEWVAIATNPFKQEDEQLLIYATTEEEAIEQATAEFWQMGWKLKSININHILHYYIDEYGDFKSILTKEYDCATSLTKFKRFRSEENYFQALAQMG